ncbi:unnamed protein product [Peronospora belbahrii]|uniref:Uncharacterized protein n=1 Tax=Peronospora belbahrii TaxID=622444 RepID=A0AAU9KQ71_9STRA|nr:unnamed protein product [Peronospora belbahrii]
MTRRLRRSDGVAIFGLLWAASCVFLLTLRFSPRESATSTPSVVLKSQVFDDTYFISNADLSNQATLLLVETLPMGGFCIPLKLSTDF